ncbi:radical SAM protein [bacterium]|nr:radical SAM protein [bacterium]
MKRWLDMVLSHAGLSRLLQKTYVTVSKRLYTLPPVNFVLYLTYNCNWRCQMCFHHNGTFHERAAAEIVRRRGEELSLEEFKRIIRELKALGVKSLPLHGGEPLLAKNFTGIVRYAASLGLRLSMVSNLSFWDEEKMRAAAECLSEVAVSIHGPAAVHDSVVGRPGSLVTQTENLLRLKALADGIPGSNLRLGATMVISALNQDTIAETIQLSRNLPLSYFNLGLTTFTTPETEEQVYSLSGVERRGSELGCSRLEPRVLAVDGGRIFAQMQELKKLQPELPFPVNFLDRFGSEEQWNRYFNDLHFKRAHSECLYPWLSGVITSYGEVYPCIQLSFLSWQVGDVRRQGLREIWYGPEYRRFRKLFRQVGLLDICHKCCSTD